MAAERGRGSGGRRGGSHGGQRGPASRERQLVGDRGCLSSHCDSPGLAGSENDGGGGVASGEGERSNWHRKGAGD